MSITREIRPALSMVVLFTIALGVVLPVAFTEVMQAVLPWQANGSLIVENGHEVGSALIGQNFTEAKYFQPRPSALDTPYDAGVSGASNLAPTSAALMKVTAQRVAAYIKAYGPGPVPADAVTSSGSGLDPDISLANALRQAPAIAKARNLPVATVTQLLEKMTHHSFMGIIGTNHLNVLALNLALDHLPAS